MSILLPLMFYLLIFVALIKFTPIYWTMMRKTNPSICQRIKLMMMRFILSFISALLLIVVTSFMLQEILVMSYLWDNNMDSADLEHEILGPVFEIGITVISYMLITLPVSFSIFWKKYQ